MPKEPKKFWMMKKTNNDEADISIDGEIVSYKWNDADTTGASFRDDLKELGNVKTINLHINSPGGSVFEGISIFNQLKQNKAKINVYVDGLAASIASVIAMSGDTIFMPENSMLMIHNPWTVSMGNAKELRKTADELERIGELSVKTYLAKANSKVDDTTLRQLMDDETWLTADEAVSYGLADEILPTNQMVACVPDKFKNMFKNMPNQLIKDKTSVNSINSKFRNGLTEKAKKQNKEIKNYLGGIV